MWARRFALEPRAPRLPPAVSPNPDRTMLCTGLSSGDVFVFCKSASLEAEYVYDNERRIHSAPLG